MKNKASIIKFTQWEHWPTFMFYLPLVPFFLRKTLTAKSPIYFVSTNPGIFFSGSGTESKFKTLSLIPEDYRPISILVKKKETYSNVIDRLEKSGIQFPLIAKPDIGFRGYLVKKINNPAHLKSYLNQIDEPIIIQEYIDFSNEIGIFYHRIPGESIGKITSITIKKYLSVIGDGKQTLSNIILNDERAFLYYELLQNIHGDKLNKIPKEKKKLVLSTIGNHSKGTQFINGNHLIDKDLECFFDKLSTEIKGWNYGRMDIKYKDIDSLKAGKDFKILEINGIISEPTHIYDATHKDASYLAAVQSIKSHWKVLDKIAKKNHAEYNFSYPKTSSFLKNMWWLRTYSKKLKVLNKKQI